MADLSTAQGASHNACHSQVLQPIFNLLAEQVGLMGFSKEQPALRLGYDDVNESASIAAVSMNSSCFCSTQLMSLCGGR